MKTKTLFTTVKYAPLLHFTWQAFAFCLLPFAFSYSQAPESFNYQAVARDNTGQVLQSQALNVKIGILSGSAADTLQWEEIHEVTTNEFGLFTIQIGTETKTSGVAAEFSAIEWNSDTGESKGLGTGNNIGVIAQEVENIFPELVKEDEEGNKAVNYSNFAPVLIEAIKEQQKQIEELRKEVAALKKGKTLGSRE